MSSLTNYAGLQVVTPDPSGSGGLAINNNFKFLADRAIGQVKLDATVAPTTDDDDSNTGSNGTFSVGSFWVDVTGDKTYICLDPSTGAAVWLEVGDAASLVATSSINQPNGVMGLDGDGAAEAIILLAGGPAASLSDVVPLELQPMFSTDTQKLVIGDGATAFASLSNLLSGSSSSSTSAIVKHPDMLRVVSCDATEAYVLVESSTRHYAVRWWDGTITFDTYTKAVPASGAWSGPSPKEIYVWPCASGTDATISGHIEAIFFFGTHYLVDINLSDPSQLEEIDVIGQKFLKTLDVTGATNNLYLSTEGSLIETFIGLDTLTSVELVGINGNTEIETIDISGSSVSGFNANGCTSLSSIRAVGCILSDSSGGFYYGTDLTNCNMDATALNQFFTDLAEDTGATGYIIVTGNPGAATCDTSIATAKGYTVVTA